MSTTSAILVGDLARVDFSFTVLQSETAADPDIVKIIHRNPMLVETVYEFGLDPEITKLGTGSYRFETVIGNQPRTHWFRSWGSGEVDKSDEDSVTVTESYMSEPLPE